MFWRFAAIENFDSERGHSLIWGILGTTMLPSDREGGLEKLLAGNNLISTAPKYKAKPCTMIASSHHLGGPCSCVNLGAEKISNLKAMKASTSMQAIQFSFH